MKASSFEHAKYERLKKLGSFQICQENHKHEDDKFDSKKYKEDLKRDTIELINYQVEFNDKLGDNEFDINGEYMEFVTQFGTIIMFSSVFPLAALICMIQNYWHLLFNRKEIKYNKRMLP